MKNRNSKGFTLIELLIVITIIGILAAALLPSVLGAPARARDAARKADLNNIIAALETYNSDNQSYPSTTGCIGTDVTDLDAYFQGGSAPEDPQGTGAQAVGGCTGYYFYCPLDGNPASYLLATYVENDKDADGKNSDLTALACDGTEDSTTDVALDPSGIASGDAGALVIMK